MNTVIVGKDVWFCTTIIKLRCEMKEISSVFRGLEFVEKSVWLATACVTQFCTTKKIVLMK